MNNDWKERFDEEHVNNCSGSLDTVHCGRVNCDTHYGYTDKVKAFIEAELKLAYERGRCEAVEEVHKWLLLSVNGYADDFEDDVVIPFEVKFLTEFNCAEDYLTMRAKAKSALIGNVAKAASHAQKSKLTSKVMKQQIEQLIDSLADKSLTFGCRIYCHKDLKIRVITNDKTKRQWWLSLDPPSYRERFSKYLIQTEEGTLGLGDGEYADYKVRIEILGHPILIGDVLHLANERGKEIVSGSLIPNAMAIEWAKKLQVLMKLWGMCGFTKSLQEIFDCEWRLFAECECGEYYPLPASPFYQEHCERHRCIEKQEPKDPAVKALGEFLLKLNLNAPSTKET